MKYVRFLPFSRLLSYDMKEVTYQWTKLSRRRLAPWPPSNNWRCQINARLLNRYIDFPESFENMKYSAECSFLWKLIYHLKPEPTFGTVKVLRAYYNNSVCHRWLVSCRPPPPSHHVWPGVWNALRSSCPLSYLVANWTVQPRGLRRRSAHTFCGDIRNLSHLWTRCSVADWSLCPRVMLWGSFVWSAR